MSWKTYDVRLLTEVGVAPEAADRLSGKGLPVDAHKMFVWNDTRVGQVRALLIAGQCLCLGDFEDGVNTYWLGLSNSSVWMLRGYDSGAQQVGYVNRNAAAFQTFLERWVRFIECGASEEDDDYDDLVQGMIENFTSVDDSAFDDEDHWWARIFEEVELGVLGPGSG